MSKMWKGPCEALTATYSCSIASRLHRRAGEQLIAYDTNHAGTLANVYRLEKRGDQWFRIDLGAVEGADPMNTFINAALAYTRHDQELFSLISRQIERRMESLIATLRYLDRTVDEVADTLSLACNRIYPNV